MYVVKHRCCTETFTINSVYEKVLQNDTSDSISLNSLSLEVSHVFEFDLNISTPSANHTRETIIGWVGSRLI